MNRRWLTLAMVMAFHRESIARFGGSDGVRDQGLLESALARRRNRASYEDEVSPFALAADYCFGIIRNHPFVDGNKRSGILAGAVFLSLNGYDFEPEETAVVQVILDLAAGNVDEEFLARWFEDSSKPKIEG